METRYYAILTDRRLIRVAHFDLNQSYWKRGQSRYETYTREISRVLMQASGLQRLKTRHNLRYGYVEFQISARLFNQAACALRMTYAPYEHFEERLKGFPD